MRMAKDCRIPLATNRKTDSAPAGCAPALSIPGTTVDRQSYRPSGAPRKPNLAWTTMRRIFVRLRHEMVEDLRQEEHVVFPVVLDLMAVGRPVPQLQSLRAGNLEIDLRQRLLLREGKEVHLSPKEFDLRVFMMRNQGALLTRGKLLHSVWDRNTGTNRSLRTYVRYLRKKIESDPPNPSTS